MPPRREETAHEAFQRQILEVCTIYGWKHLHVRRAIGKHRGWVTPTNRDGWPDLFLWHPRKGGVCSIEVKIHPDAPSDEQREVLTELAVAGVPSMVIYPSEMNKLIPFLLNAVNEAAKFAPLDLPPVKEPKPKKVKPSL